MPLALRRVDGESDRGTLRTVQLHRCNQTRRIGTRNRYVIHIVNLPAFTVWPFGEAAKLRIALTPNTTQSCLWDKPHWVCTRYPSSSSFFFCALTMPNTKEQKQKGKGKEQVGPLGSFHANKKRQKLNQCWAEQCGPCCYMCLSRWARDSTDPSDASTSSGTRQLPGGGSLPPVSASTALREE
jgi:hypothetical protein